MDKPTFVISALLFVIFSVLIIFFLIKEGIKYYKNNKDKEV